MANKRTAYTTPKRCQVINPGDVRGEWEQCPGVWEGKWARKNAKEYRVCQGCFESWLVWLYSGPNFKSE